MKINKELEKEMKENYIEGYSSTEIKNIIFNKYRLLISTDTIRKRLKKLGVQIRDVRESIILHHRRKQPINEIIGLYNNNIPIRELSRKYGIGRGTLRKILKENNIAIKDSRSALISMGYIKEKNKFSIDPKEQAYLFGLVLGDLTPVRKSEFTLKLITHTTHKTFADLLYKIFNKYGVTSYKTNKEGYFRFQTHVDLESFSFLLETKKNYVPLWINKNNFLAGFIDSDGSVIVRKSGNYFQFVIRFYGQNLEVLNSIKIRLGNIGYDLSIHKNHSKGDISYHNGRKFVYNKDYFVIETYKKDQTIDLLSKVPIRHPEKIAKRDLIFKIKKRKNVRWDEIKSEVKLLKLKIKKSVEQRISLENLS